MKKTLTIILLLLATAAGAQTATEKYNAFKELLKTYELTSLPESQQQDTITKWYQLEAASIYEQAQIEQQQKVTDSIARSVARSNYILHLKAVGYACNNSKADWRKAYDKPEWFGANWQAKADQAWSASTGLDSFLNFCMQYNY